MGLSLEEGLQLSLVVLADENETVRHLTPAQRLAIAREELPKLIAQLEERRVEFAANQPKPARVISILKGKQK